MNDPRLHKNVLEEARSLIRENVEIPTEYVKALYLTQLFEVQLDSLYSILVYLGSSYFEKIGLNYSPEKRDKWTINDYLKRLRTFFPNQKFKNDFETLERVQKKRNDFVHKCFFIKDGAMKGISVHNEKLHLNERALERTRDWISAYAEASKVIQKFTLITLDSITKA